LSARPGATELSAAARWSIVCLLSAVLLINYIDRGTVSTAAHLIQDELGFSEKQLGVLLSAFFWTYSITQIGSGWLAERFGAQRVLTAGLIVWACATMLVGVAHSFAALLALRLLLGVGESVGFPSVCKLLAQVVPVSSLGVANGITAFGYLFGPAVGSYYGSILMERYGWRSAFWVFGALSLVWLVPWSRVRLPQRQLEAACAKSPPFSAILRQPSLWGTAIGLFSSNYTFFFLLTWLPYYLVRERGFSTVEMGRLTGSSYIVNAVSALAAGWLIDRLIRRYGRPGLWYKTLLASAHIGSVACMLVMGLAERPWAIAALFVYQVLSGTSSAGVFTVSQILAGPSASARWVGIQNCTGNLAGALAPALTGIIVQETHHFAGAFVLGALVSILGLVGWVWMIPRLAPLEWGEPSTRALPEPAH
jgi:MFS family permease